MSQPEVFRPRWILASNFVREGRLKDALGIFQELANDGYSEAYVEIGNMLERGGEEVCQDLDSARRWYMKAVEEADDPFGYVGLARLAINGFKDAGTVSDAVEYLEIACKANNPVAQTILGSLYHSGRLVPQDLALATVLYERASSQGYVLPMLFLSKIMWNKRRYIDAFVIRATAMWRAYRISRHDVTDPRLWNYLSV